MKTLFSPEALAYDGTQLRSHFAYRQFGLLGDSCVAFVGACNVTLEHMVDLEDVQQQRPIYSPLMLHFILEHYTFTLREAVAFQRLMVVNVVELLQEQGIQDLTRFGDDIFLGQNGTKKKLSVSIAAPSPVSVMIHLGINVETAGTPVPTIGLKDWKIESENFAQDCLQRFYQEEQSLQRASYKVRSVH